VGARFKDNGIIAKIISGCQGFPRNVNRLPTLNRLPSGVFFRPLGENLVDSKELGEII
jgi:hypothetical protein